MSVMVGLLAGLAAVTLKNITYFIESLAEKGIVLSGNELHFIFPIIGLTLVYLYVKFVHKDKLATCYFFHTFCAIKKERHNSLKKIYTPLITAPLTVGFGGSVGLLGPAVASGLSDKFQFGKSISCKCQDQVLVDSLCLRRCHRFHISIANCRHHFRRGSI